MLTVIFCSIQQRQRLYNVGKKISLETTSSNLQIPSIQKYLQKKYCCKIKGLRASQDMVDLSLLLMAGHKAFGRPSGNIGFQGEDVLENDNVCDYVFQSTLCWQNLPSYCLLPLVWFNLFFSIGSSSSFLDSAEFHSLLRII